MVSPDYAHPMPPFEALPEPTEFPAAATSCPSWWQIVSTRDRTTSIQYTLNDEHRTQVNVHKKSGNIGCVECKTANVCEHAYFIGNHRRAAA